MQGAVPLGNAVVQTSLIRHEDATIEPDVAPYSQT